MHVNAIELEYKAVASGGPVLLTMTSVSARIRGYLLKGRVKMHTRDGEQVYVYCSPTDEFNQVIEPIKGEG